MNAERQTLARGQRFRLIQQRFQLIGRHPRQTFHFREAGFPAGEPCAHIAAAAVDESNQFRILKTSFQSAGEIRA